MKTPQRRQPSGVVTDFQGVDVNKRTCRCGTEFVPTHGRQTCCTIECRKPSHAKVTRRCDWCGGEAEKYAGKARYAATYCGLVCRDQALSGQGPRCTLPADHWARWWGSTSTWTARHSRAAFRGCTCTECGARFVERTIGGTPSLHCSTTCSRRVMKRRRRARESGAQGEYTYAQLIKQYQRQGLRCAYCEKAIAGAPEPEHVLPLSRGGRNDMTNIVAACGPCNREKSDMTLTEWAAWRDARGKTKLNNALKGDAFARIVHQEPAAQSWRQKQAA